MTVTTHADLARYLKRHGWRHGTPGAYGSLWAIDDSDPVGITHSLTSASPDWNIVVQKLAQAMRRDADEVRRDLDHLYVDEIEFAATGVGTDSISVEEGARLFEMARISVRATATTSRGEKPYIRGNYSRGGDAIVERVRFGHTRPGSYVVPVLFSLDPPLTEAARDSESQGAQPELDREIATAAAENAESDQRRASRTLVQAFAALDVFVVQPAKDPSPSVVAPLARAGVSREMVNGIVDFLKSTEDASAMRARPNWAGAPKPPVAPAQVTIEAEAVDVLRKTAEHLRIVPPHKHETVTGPIVGVHVTDGRRDRSLGVSSTIEIQAIRRGRLSTIHVRTSAHQWADVNEWMRKGETVSAYGVVKSVPGRLEMDAAEDLQPLGQQFLTAD